MLYLINLIRRLLGKKSIPHETMIISYRLKSMILDLIKQQAAYETDPVKKAHLLTRANKLERENKEIESRYMIPVRT